MMDKGEVDLVLGEYDVKVLLYFFDLIEVLVIGDFFDR